MNQVIVTLLAVFYFNTLSQGGIIGDIYTLWSTDLTRIPADTTHLYIERDLPHFPNLTRLTKLNFLYTRQVGIPEPDLPIHHYLPPSITDITFESNNLFTRIPDFSKLQSLTNLHIEGHNIQDRDENDSNRLFPASLQSIYIVNTQITKFPDLSYTNVGAIHLSYNQIDSIPDPIPIPSNVWMIELTGNKLNCIPDLSTFSRITTLYLEEMTFTCDLDLENPYQIFPPELEDLGIRLPGVPNLQPLSEIYRLFLDGSDFSPRIDSPLSEILPPGVRILHMENCGLEEFSNIKSLRELTTLDLKDNMIQVTYCFLNNNKM